MADHEHGMTWKKYWWVFAALMVLLFLTIYIAYQHIDPTLAILAAMTIAVIKAVLVVLYFMHVRFNSKLTWLFVISGFVWLLIMIGITLTDYKTRGWEESGYSELEQTFSSPYKIPAAMQPQNMDKSNAHHHGEESGEGAGAEAGAEEGSGN